MWSPHAVDTPVASARVVGTQFILSATEQRTELLVLEGAVDFYNRLGRVTAHEMERTEATLGEAPTKPQKVPWATWTGHQWSDGVLAVTTPSATRSEATKLASGAKRIQVVGAIGAAVLLGPGGVLEPEALARSTEAPDQQVQRSAKNSGTRTPRCARLRERRWRRWRRRSGTKGRSSLPLSR